MGWESSDDRFDLGLFLQGQTMVHWLWGVVFPVDTNLHRCTTSSTFLVWYIQVIFLVQYIFINIEYKIM